MKVLNMADSSDSNTSKKPIFEYPNNDNSFTNVININVRNDHIHLGIGTKDIDDPNRVIINQSIYMTVEHFLKFSEICSETANDIQDQIKKVNLDTNNI